MTSTDNRRSGDRFGPFRLHERLGVGGMATVQRATEHLLDSSTREVALKRILPHLVDDEQFVRSFAHEAKLAMMLDHPNIVRVYELGRVDYEYFISMEFIDGQDLRHVLRQASRAQKVPSPEVVLSLLLPLCRGVAYAHEKTDDEGRPLKLIHRDISPANVIIAKNGTVKVIDFGIARVSLDPRGTRTGGFKGKLGYMSPESLVGGDIDCRSDIWSIGVLAHELITARQLFYRKNDFTTLQRVRRMEVPAPSEINTTCPAELDAIILRALERKTDNRWQSAQEMVDALSALARNLNIVPSRQIVANWCEDIRTAPIVRRSRRTTVSEIIPTPDEDASLPHISAKVLAEIPDVKNRISDASYDSAQTEVRAAPVRVPGPEFEPRISFRPPSSAGSSLSMHSQEPPAESMAEAVLQEILATTPPEGNALAIEIEAETPLPRGKERWPAGTRPPRLRRASTPLEFASSDATQLDTANPVRTKEHFSGEHFTGELEGQAAHSTPVIPDRRPVATTPMVPKAMLAVTGLALVTAVLAVAALTFQWGANSEEDSQFGTLQVEVEPANASLSLDGKPATALSQLEPATYQLQVRHDGYEPWTEEVVIEAGNTLRYRVQLEEKAIASAPKQPTPAEAAPISLVAEGTAIAADARKVKKISGGALRLSSELSGPRGRVRFQMCIDAQGKVSSLAILSNLPKSGRASTREQLLTWRFLPFEVEGKAVAACFSDSTEIR